MIFEQYIAYVEIKKIQTDVEKEKLLNMFKKFLYDENFAYMLKTFCVRFVEDEHVVNTESAIEHIEKAIEYNQRK